MSTSSITTIVKPKRKRIISTKLIFLLLLLIIGVLAGYYYLKSRTSVNGQIQQQTAVARRGDLTVAISGSGTLASSSTLTAQSSVEGTISKIYYEDGDKVEIGSLIMELDSGEALLDVKKLENSMAQARLSREQLLKSMDSSIITAPISGEITEIRYKTGETAGKDSALLTITDKSKLKVLLPFKNSNKDQIHLGQEASIYVFDDALDEVHQLGGVVSFISSAQQEVEGAQACNVEFVVENPGYLDDTMIASAQINLSGQSIQSIGNEMLSYKNSIAVKTEIGGEIENFDAVLGQYVREGDILANITNDDISLELETGALNIEGMENQLEYAMDKLSHYKIYSTISGTLALEDIKEGDAVKSGQTVFTVSNYDLMEFQIPIDELDIAKIQTGQSVNISVDALTETTEKPLAGIVTEIEQEGSPSNGVTTYPVTVQLNEPNNSLKVGMNVNGEIVVNEKKDVLYIPVEAVQKRGKNNIVYVRSEESKEASDTAQSGAKDGRKASTDQQTPAVKQSANGQPASEDDSTARFRTKGQGSNYYAGAAAKVVEVGINNDEYIEILSGLKEGDIVILPQLSSNSDSGNNQMRTNFGTGGMPGGGMPVRITTGGQGR